MSYWNYRVIRKYHAETNSNTFHIHEVYYHETHEIDGWTESAVEPMGETLSELREDIRFFIKAFQKPVLIEKLKNGKIKLMPDEENRFVNENHYAELIDRTWVCSDYAYQLIGSHPLVRKEKELQDLYTKAEEALSNLYKAIEKIEDLNKNSR
jgi:hypothetical protein